MGQTWELRPVEPQGMGEETRSVTILHIGGGDHYLEHEALRVDQEVALASLHLLVDVEAARAPL